MSITFDRLRPTTWRRISVRFQRERPDDLSYGPAFRRSQYDGSCAVGAKDPVHGDAPTTVHWSDITGAKPKALTRRDHVLLMGVLWPPAPARQYTANVTIDTLSFF
jgi:hypothetical protein